MAVRWITDCLMIYCVICASSHVDAESSRALLLYSSDSQAMPALNNLISIQLDSITLSKIIANSEAQGRVVKKINFRNENGFAKLVEGASSKFSFVNAEENLVCDASCEVQCKSMPLSSTLEPQGTNSTEKPKLQTAKSSLISKVKNESFSPSTYLPPVSEKIENASEKSTSTSTKISSTSLRTTTESFTEKTTTSQATTTKKPQTTTKLVSAKELQSTTKSTSTIKTSTAPPVSQFTTKGSTTQTKETSLNQSSTTQTTKSTSAFPRPYIAKKDDGRGPPYLPPHNKIKDEGLTRPTTRKISFTSSPTRKPITLSTTIPTRRLSTQSPVVQLSTQTSTKRRSTPGPAYLPIARKTTIRRATVTERSYPPATWPSTTRSYTQTFPSWSAPIRRSTEARIVTTTGKYSYRAPVNSLIYVGEAE